MQEFDKYELIEKINELRVDCNHRDKPHILNNSWCDECDKKIKQLTNAKI